MFSRLFRRQSANAAPIPESPEKGGVADSNLGSKPTEHADSAAASTSFRVLICQDTGDKKKTPLFDTVQDQSNSSNTPGLSCSLPQPVPHVRNTHGRENNLSTSLSSESLSKLGYSRRPRSILSGGTTSEELRSSSYRHTYAGKNKVHRNLDLLGEMMFGAVPLTSRGVATKVHYFRAPNPQIMLSKVFTMSSEPNEEDEEAATQSLRTHSRLSSLSSSESTQWPDYPGNRNSQATPGSFYGSFTQSFQSDPYLSRNSYGRPVSWQNDTGKYGVSPASSMISTLSALTEGSGSYRRRKLERFSFQSAGRSGDSSMSSSPGSTSALKKPRRRISFGVGLILDCGGNSRLRDFFFTHFILIERHLIELQTIILSLILQNLRSRTPDVTGQGNFNLSGATVGPEFLDTLTWFPIPYALQLDLEMADAIQKFQDQVYALFAFPRLQEPLWLDMMSFPAKHKTVAETLVNDIKSLHATLDSPMNHFLAKALTVVLGQHLAWTGTVASLLGDKGAKSGTRLSKASASDPYNPYMAQINDLYGNIGLPPSASRTIIVGKDATKVKQMLRMLSYFIRCGELVEEVQHMLPNDIDNSNAAESELCPTYLEVPMPRTLIFRTIPDSNISEDQAPTRELHNFTYGRSLLGGYCPRYAADFALMGVPREPYLHALESDLKDLSEMSSAPAAANLINLDELRCETIRCDGQDVFLTTQSAVASPLVANLLKSVIGVRSCGLPPETCMGYIEDQLQNIYNKSVLVSMTLSHSPSIGFDSLISVLDVHSEDMSLLFRVASTFDDAIGGAAKCHTSLPRTVWRSTNIP